MKKVTTLSPDIFKRFRFLRGNYHLLFFWPFLATILCLIGSYLLYADLRADRKELEDQTFKEVRVLSESYANQLTHMVQTIDQVALQVRYHWESAKGQLQLNDEKAKAAFPSVSNFYIAIIDQNGLLLTGTLPTPENMIFKEREYFEAQKNSTEDILYIGKPFIGVISEKIFIPFSRRLHNEKGEFAGVVIVAVVPSYFTASYNKATFGKNGLLGIIGNDNAIRVIRTGDEVYSLDVEKIVRPGHFPMLSNTALLEGNRWFTDKHSRYIGWSMVSDYPLGAIAGLDQQEVFASYWAKRAAKIRDATLAAVGLAIFTLIAMALSVRLAWGKYQLRTIQSAYRIATEHGGEGFYIAEPLFNTDKKIIDFKVIDCNQRGAEFFFFGREELIGKKISSLYEKIGPDRIVNMLCQALENGLFETEMEVPAGSNFAARWVYFRIASADSTVAVTLRDISHAKEHVKELERRSNEDMLTGLPNRYWLQNELSKAIDHAASTGAMLALLFIDLDGFKAVNDTMGHETGDEVLRLAAKRLKVAVRDHDRIARLGGDEFIVILNNIVQKLEAAHVAERILHAFQETFKVSKGVYPVGASIGISVYPSDGKDANTLLHHADIAMYSVKTSGKRNYRFYDKTFYQALLSRLEKEKELRHALEQNQFVMYYQPRVEIATGMTCSMEALVRWAHPTKGLISPLEFIPLAEETGLILQLGEMVIDKVCAQLAYWARGGCELVPVSINVSSRQVNEVNVAEIISTCLRRYDIDPRLIEVEITESSVMGDSDDATNALTAIQRLGIRLSVDDFGTGYSSLSQLQRLDFDVLKVDRAFTTELGKTKEGKVFFTAIITMAHALGMRVVAEGVENLEQLKILKLLGCDEIQGFYISMPLPASETQPVLPKQNFSIDDTVCRTSKP